MWEGQCPLSSDGKKACRETSKEIAFVQRDIFQIKSPLLIALSFPSLT